MSIMKGVNSNIFGKGKHRYLLKTAIIIFAITAVSSLIGYMGSLYWVLDLFSHYREYYLYLFASVSILFIYLKARTYAIISTIFCVLHILPFIPFYIAPSIPLHAQQDTITIFAANVKGDNTEYQKLVQHIKKTDPDVIMLTEFNSRWMDGIDEIIAVYPHRVQSIREDNFGIILLSKNELEHRDVITLGLARKPSVLAVVKTKGKSLAIIGTHPLPPFSRWYARSRDDQMRGLAQLINAQSHPTVLVGDLNASPFSYIYKYLVTESNMIHCGKGFGYQRTWQLRPLLPPLRLAIDHCLYTAGISVVDSYIGDDIGSDHLPIINTIKVYDTQ